MKNGLKQEHHKPLTCLARPAGIEPATPWFVAGSVTNDFILNQYAATPAIISNSLHNASVSLTAAYRVTF
jgi:hypothetical protein